MATLSLNSSPTAGSLLTRAAMLRATAVSVRPFHRVACSTSAWLLACSCKASSEMAVACCSATPAPATMVTCSATILAPQLA